MPSKKSPKKQTSHNKPKPFASKAIKSDGVKPKGKVRKRRKITLQIRPKDPSLLDHDEVLRKINFVQVKRQDVHFKISTVECLFIENILRDAGLLFTKKGAGDVSIYHVQPGVMEQEGAHALEFLEELDDEILEDGQIFD